jgi:hypothetical protein
VGCAIAGNVLNIKAKKLINQSLMKHLFRATLHLPYITHPEFCGLAELMNLVDKGAHADTLTTLPTDASNMRLW